jgi:hypothetical protein
MLPPSTRKHLTPHPSPLNYCRCRSAGASAAAQAQLRLWGQCGGQGGSCKEAGAGACVDGPYPGKSCPAGSSCLKQSNWYYQCLPSEGYTCIPTDGKAPGGPGGSQFTLNWWDQCGGMGGNCNNYQCVDNAYANYACPSGTSCQRQNQWVSGRGAAGFSGRCFFAGWIGGTRPAVHLTLGPGQAQGCLRKELFGSTKPTLRHPPNLDTPQYFQCLPGSGGWSGSGSGSGSTLNLWDQCGGKGGNCAQYTCVDAIYPGQSCPAGSSCQRLHEWFSQCRPGGTSYGTCEQVALWSQCGGKSSRAGTNATDGVSAVHCRVCGLAAHSQSVCALSLRACLRS